MQQTPLGTSGLHISEYAFGSGSIGGVGAAAAMKGKGISSSEGWLRLDEAHALGITLIDTADSYAGGESERVVGEWLAARRPPHMLVASKVGIVYRSDGSRVIDNSPGHIERTLSSSEARLGRVDLFLLHARDTSAPLERTLAAFSDAQSTGRIRGYGLCNIGPQGLVEVLETTDRLGLNRPIVVENRLNLLDRTDERELLPLVHREGLGYTAFSPLAGGVLSDRYLNGAAIDPRSRIAIAGDSYYSGFHSPANLARVDALHAVAQELGVSVSALALAWLRDHPAVTAPIVAPSRAEHWAAVKESNQVRVTDSLRERVSAIFD
jgi:aryl-alcohol dehydrogenase-like predicted oxidoreductase